eukprot:scaffold1134_cov295-Prasinococcus_capsulatus_cf.AAC.13
MAKPWVGFWGRVVPGRTPSLPLPLSALRGCSSGPVCTSLCHGSKDFSAEDEFKRLSAAA